jgi:predicted P-loop ATPase
MKKADVEKMAEFLSLEGIGFIPLTLNKTPIISGWRADDYQPSVEQVAGHQLGILTGEKSGITVVDIDLVSWSGIGTDPKLFPATYTVRTPSGGFHKYYKYDERITQGSCRFKKFPGLDIRNNGGYVVAPPSVCSYRKTVKDETRTVSGSYEVVEGSLLDLAPFPYELFKDEIESKPVAPMIPSMGINYERPGDDFDERGSWDEILTGYMRGAVSTEPDGTVTTKWTRPGKKEGTSATTRKKAGDKKERLFIYSTNAEPFEPYDQTRHNSYTKTSAYALLHHGGNFYEAVSALRAKGFGKQVEPNTPGELVLMTIVKNKGKSNEEEVIVINDENIMRILIHHNVAKYDSFKNRAYLNLGGEWVRRDDGADGLLYSWLLDKYPFLATVTLKKVSDLITPVQYRNVYDSAQEYLASIAWDGVPRLNTWLSKVFFVDDKDTHYHAIGSKWWMGMVARILDPGTKFEGVLLLQGGQEIGKSSVFMIIADGDFSQSNSETNHIEFTDLRMKEMQQDMQGKMVVEFAEGAIFSKSDTETVKSIVSRTTDTYRIPYERNARDFQRRCVFGVTANQSEILKDDTGGRRWWNVEMPEDMQCYPPKRQADIFWLKDNRDQLFAEAAVRYQNGEDFQKIDGYELQKRQKSITATEQDEDLFRNWYHNLSAGRQNEGVSVREAYVGAYKVDGRGETLREDVVSIKKADEMRIGRILKRMGLEKRHVDSGNVWFPGENFDRNYRIKLYKTEHEYGWS